ncbi:hypothetical protein ACOMHN_008740 [Nucella lapillus]
MKPAGRRQGGEEGWKPKHLEKRNVILTTTHETRTQGTAGRVRPRGTQGWSGLQRKQSSLGEPPPHHINDKNTAVSRMVPTPNTDTTTTRQKTLP